MSRDKEPDFFLRKRNFRRGAAWYSDQFASVSGIRGEASPNYSKCHVFRGVPERIAALCPDVQLIYVVRDPVARAESHIRHNVIMGSLAIDAEDFVEKEDYRHVLDTSRYAFQLEAYLAHFPPEAVLVLDFEELIHDTDVAMGRVHAHIGVSDRTVSNAAVQNDSRQLSRVPAPILRLAQTPQGRAITRHIGRGVRDRLRSALARGRPRNPPPFPEALRERLRADLAEDAARFRDLTGLEFASWSV